MKCNSALSATHLHLCTKLRHCWVQSIPVWRACFHTAGQHWTLQELHSGRLHSSDTTLCITPNMSCSLLLLWLRPTVRELWNDVRCLSVSPSVRHMPWPNSRTERPRKPKTGTMEVHHTSNPSTYLQVKRSRSPGRLMLSQTMQHMQVAWNSRDEKVKVKSYSIK